MTEEVNEKKKVIVLFDGDVLAYRAAAAIEERSIKVTHVPSGKTKPFKTRTEFKKMMKEKGKEDQALDEAIYKIEDVQVAEDVSHALHILKTQLNNICTDLWTEEYKIFISGKQNFRDDLPLPDKYKGQRTDMIRPVHLQEAKMYLYKNHPCEVSDYAEADDYLIFRGYEYVKQGYNVILVTVDKDANAYSGLSVHDYTQPFPCTKPIPEFGGIRDTGKKIAGDGFMFYCFQMLFGDPVDNYKPCKLAGLKYGEVSAYNDLKDCRTEKEALKKVIEVYQEWYPKEFEYTDWCGEIHSGQTYKDMLQLFHKCVRMKETEDDDLDFEKFCKRFGVKL